MNRIPAGLRLVCIDLALSFLLYFGAAFLVADQATITDWGDWLRAASMAAIFKVAPDLLGYVFAARDRIRQQIPAEYIRARSHPVIGGEDTDAPPRVPV